MTPRSQGNTAPLTDEALKNLGHDSTSAFETRGMYAGADPAESASSENFARNADDSKEEDADDSAALDDDDDDEDEVDEEDEDDDLDADPDDDDDEDDVEDDAPLPLRVSN